MAKAGVCVNCGYRHDPKDTNPQKKGQKSIKNDKNPYSNRGQEKFLALLAEIEAKKQTVVNQVGPEEIKLVQFEYTDKNKLRPVIIRANPKKKDENKRDDGKVLDGSSAMKEVKEEEIDMKDEGKEKFIGKMNLPVLKPSYGYLVAGLILVMLLLALSERYKKTQILLQQHPRLCQKIQYK